MQVEEFDFAIYGSGIDAAFLAAELIRRHDSRVLLIRDHVNDYTMPHHQDFSVGGNCDPATIRMVQYGLKNWLSHFSGSAGRACFDRGPLSLKVSSKENAELLHYIEGALIACDRPSERKASREGDEFLRLRDVVAPKKREGLEYLHGAYLGVGMEVFDRSHFQTAKRLQDGRLTLKSDTTRYTASQTVVLDDDLLAAHSNAAMRSILVPEIGTKIAFRKLEKYSRPPVFCVDSQMYVRQVDHNSIAISAPLCFDELAFHGKKEVPDIEQLQMTAQGAYHSISTNDGSPLLGLHKRKMTWVFTAGTVRTFLMPSVADIVAKSSNGEPKNYWADRGAIGRQCSDIVMDNSNVEAV